MWLTVTTWRRDGGGGTTPRRPGLGEAECCRREQVREDRQRHRERFDRRRSDDDVGLFGDAAGPSDGH
jgi:hypothetical protein